EGCAAEHRTMADVDVAGRPREHHLEAVEAAEAGRPGASRQRTAADRRPPARHNPGDASGSSSAARSASRRAEAVPGRYPEPTAGQPVTQPQGQQSMAE